MSHLGSPVFFVDFFPSYVISYVQINVGRNVIKVEIQWKSYKRIASNDASQDFTIIAIMVIIIIIINCTTKMRNRGTLGSGNPQLK
jgi:xanthine/uracil permease